MTSTCIVRKTLFTFNRSYHYKYPTVRMWTDKLWNNRKRVFLQDNFQTHQFHLSAIRATLDPQQKERSSNVNTTFDSVTLSCIVTKGETFRDRIVCGPFQTCYACVALGPRRCSVIVSLRLSTKPLSAFWSQLPLLISYVTSTVKNSYRNEYKSNTLSIQADGFIARKFSSQASRLGTFLDPLADKILIISLFSCLTYAELIPSRMLQCIN